MPIMRWKQWRKNISDSANVKTSNMSEMVKTTNYNLTCWTKDCKMLHHESVILSYERVVMFQTEYNRKFYNQFGALCSKPRNSRAMPMCRVCLFSLKGNFNEDNLRYNWAMSTTSLVVYPLMSSSSEILNIVI